MVKHKTLAQILKARGFKRERDLTGYGRESNKNYLENLQGQLENGEVASYVVLRDSNHANVYVKYDKISPPPMIRRI